MSTPPGPTSSGIQPGVLPPQGPPPGKPSNALWWALGIFAALIFMVIAGGIFTALYIARGIRVDEKGQKVEVSTPAGKISLQASNDVKSVGLPIYPGADLVGSGGGVEFTGPNDQRVGVTGVRYHTADSLEKVDDWYRQQLNSDFERRIGDSKVNFHVRGVDIDKEDIAFVAEAEGLVRVVGLKRAGSGTEIGMARIGKQATQ